MPDWRDLSLADLLARIGLEYATERALPTDGWSGASFTTLEHPDGRRFVLKRTSLAQDWIARSTRDEHLREARLAAGGRRAIPTLGATPSVSTAYLGAAHDGEGVAAILMPDLSAELIAWERPGFDPVVDESTVQRVVEAMARLHSLPWPGVLEDAALAERASPPSWCPLPERLALLSPRTAAGYARDGNPVGARFLAGWDAFAEHASAAARTLIRDLSTDVTPLVHALERLPAVGLHGDLKLANVALLADGGVALIDWQMTMRAPAAVELGWFLVSNSGALPVGPDEVLEAYRRAIAFDAGRWRHGEEPNDIAHLIGDWDAQVDLAMLVGLLLRGWRKGLDAAAGIRLASGIGAADDLAWWCDRAIEAAARRL